jgi:hypothetical protein
MYTKHIVQFLAQSNLSKWQIHYSSYHLKV